MTRTNSDGLAPSSTTVGDTNSNGAIGTAGAFFFLVPSPFFFLGATIHARVLPTISQAWPGVALRSCGSSPAPVHLWLFAGRTRRRGPCSYAACLLLLNRGALVGGRCVGEGCTGVAAAAKTGNCVELQYTHAHVHPDPSVAVGWVGVERQWVISGGLFHPDALKLLLLWWWVTPHGGSQARPCTQVTWSHPPYMDSVWIS